MLIVTQKKYICMLEKALPPAYLHLKFLHNCSIVTALHKDLFHEASSDSILDNISNLDLVVKD